MSAVAIERGDTPDDGPDPKMSEETSQGKDPSSIDQEVAFEMLSCQRRRHVLHCLRQHGAEIDLRTLSRQIAAWENDIEPVDVTYQQRVRVYTALRQAHLPKLDDCGIVRFDPDRSTVELTEQATQLDVYLDVVPHDDIAWSTYYVGLAGLCVGFATLTILGLPPFSALSGGLGALAFALLFLASGVVHVLHDRKMRIGSDGPTPE